MLSVVLMPRLNRYVIAFDDSHLTMQRALVKPRRIPWASISEIEIQLLKLDIALKEGKNVNWNLNLSYTDNQIVKPQIIAALTEFAEANGIPIQDGPLRVTVPTPFLTEGETVVGRDIGKVTPGLPPPLLAGEGAAGRGRATGGRPAGRSYNSNTGADVAGELRTYRDGDILST